MLAEEEAAAGAGGAGLRARDAGRRAGAGPAFFKENAGDFWGLIETRPDVRARAGLANTLWSLQRRDEAAQHYRALLALNPEDNQGCAIRC